MRSSFKIFATLAAGTSFALTGAAHAGEPYVGASAGLNLPSDSENRGEFDEDVAATADFDAIAAGTDLDWTSRLNNGLDLNLLAGYRLDNGVRLELQGFYNKSNVGLHRDLAVGGTGIDALDSAILTRGVADVANPTVGAVLSTDDGQIKNYGLFANALYDFQINEKLAPYVGAGVGFARQDVEYAPSGIDVVDDKKTRFAYQAMAGVTYKLSPSFEVFGQYTYRNIDRGDYDVDLLPATLGVKSEQSLFNVGFRIPLGGGN